MRDTRESKTVVVMLAIALGGMFVYTARHTRQDASAAQEILVDTTTHAHRVSPALREAQGRSAGDEARRAKTPTKALTGKPSGVVNEALGEMETLEEVQRMTGGDWRSKTGAAGRLDDWRP